MRGYTGMVVHRFAIVLLALLIGAAAPARAWCEAACTAPAHSGTSTRSHCPVHESTSPGASISAADVGDCPVIEAARPAAAARIELKAAATPIQAPQFAFAFSAMAVVAALPHASTVFKRHTPLRI